MLSSWRPKCSHLRELKLIGQQQQLGLDFLWQWLVEVTFQWGKDITNSLLTIIIFKMFSIMEMLSSWGQWVSWIYKCIFLVNSDVSLWPGLSRAICINAGGWMHYRHVSPFLLFFKDEKNYSKIIPEIPKMYWIDLFYIIFTVFKLNLG